MFLFLLFPFCLLETQALIGFNSCSIHNNVERVQLECAQLFDEPHLLCQLDIMH